MDSMTGTLVCDLCGIQPFSCTFNISPEYSRPPPEDQQIGTTRKRWFGIPRQQLSSDQRRGTVVVSKYWINLQHYNEYNVCLCHDDLLFVDSLLVTWTDIDATIPHINKVVAGLLYASIRTRFPEEGVIKNQVLNAQRMQRIGKDKPVLSFDCEECGAVCHTARAARYHCKHKHWGIKKTKRY